MPERIQKALAAAGLGSRRHIDGLLKAGRIRVNGAVAKPGDKITPADQVRVDRRAVRLAALADKPRVAAYYKPEGEICAEQDPQGRPTVFANLPKLKRGRWISVGRLDFNSAGLLLFTNDGALANELMHPRNQVEREYAARVAGRASPRQLEALLQGVELEDGPARFLRIQDAGGAGLNHWYHVVLTEGRNREVRRLWASQGLAVNRLLRIRYGNCRLPRDKRPRQFWELAQQDIQALRRAAGSPSA